MITSYCIFLFYPSISTSSPNFYLWAYSAIFNSVFPIVLIILSLSSQMYVLISTFYLLQKYCFLKILIWRLVIKKCHWYRVLSLWKLNASLFSWPWKYLNLMAPSFFVNPEKYLVIFTLNKPFLGIFYSGWYLYFATMKLSLNLCFVLPTLRKIIIKICIIFKRIYYLK